MKTIVINGVEFIKLKNDKFEYCGKTYTEERFISSDFKCYITRDNGFTFCRVYSGTKNGKAIDITQNLSDRSIYAYPFYSLEFFVDIFLKNKDMFCNKIKVNETQYF